MAGIYSQRLWLVVLFALALPACSSYQIQGVVVEGPQPGLFVVDSNDPRLTKWTAVADARVDSIIDPEKLRPKLLPSVMTDDRGRFVIPIDEPGAGLLEYTVSVYASADGYGDQGINTMPLPGSGKQVLVVLAAGRGARPRGTQSTEDLLNEAEKFKRQFE